MLSDLGRYNDSEAALSSIGHNDANQSSIAAGIDRVRAESLLDRQQFRQAYDLALRAAKANPTPEIERVLVLSEDSLGQKAKARDDARKLVAEAERLSHQNGNSRLIADADLTLATVLADTSPAEAHTLAQSALDFYSRNNLEDSQWRADYLLASIAAHQKDPTAAQAFAKKALDILGELEHTWPSQDFNSYRSRPDTRKAIRDLNALLPPRKA
jgi:hypothetical protein